VRLFYKKLKKFNPAIADKFRNTSERNVNVPYRQLREYAKNHVNTKELIMNAHQDENVLYMSFIDGDTISFNGIYSAYLRIYDSYLRKQNIPPTVISTGYEYSEERKDCDYPFVIASQIDRLVRVETAKYIPLRVYYPEPNLCVIIPNGHDTIKESFVGSDKKNKIWNRLFY